MAQLSDVLLASSKHATSGWVATAGRSYDVVMSDYGDDGWSVACNLTKIDEGTIGWIIRFDGDWGHVAGIQAISGRPQPTKEPNGIVHYAPGEIFALPHEWWIDGARLHLDGWKAKAPFGVGNSGRRMAQFQSGQTLTDALVGLIEQRLHPVALEWIDARRAAVT